MRWLPFVASFWCAPVIILAFHVLFAGFANDTLEGVAIITFNTSSLGLSDYYQMNSTLNSNVTTLVPSTEESPTVITKYLGIHDWYSVYYLSTCSGYFARSSEDENTLSSNKINITCVKKNSGYSYNIAEVLRSELHPSVIGIADEVTQATEYTAPWITLWYIGIITAVLEMFVFLPLTWPGTRRLNGWSALNTFISYICFQLSSALSSGHSTVAQHSQTPPPALYATEFFAMTWTTMCLMLVVLLLVHVEWRFELWTLKGEPITTYRKPPYKSWNLLQAFYDRHPTKIDGTGRDEEYEMNRQETGAV